MAASGMRRVVLAELRHNGRRAIGAGIAVAIAVAFVVSVLGATQTMQDYFTRASAGPQLAADAVVESGPPGEADVIGADAAGRLSGLPGVAAVYQQRVIPLEVSFPGGSSYSSVVGDPPAALRWYHVLRGAAPASPGDVLIDSRTADDLNLRVGSTLDAASLADPAGSPAGPKAPLRLRVSGIVSPIDLAGFGGRALVAADRDLLAWSPGTAVDQLTVAATPGTGQQQLRDAVAAALPQLAVLTGAHARARTAQLNTGGVDIIGRMLLMFTAVALAVATLVISNTFAIVVAQRAAQLALARCVGATRRQLRRAVLAEALAVGALASVAGAVLGVLAVIGGVALVTRLVPASGGLAPVLAPGSLAVAVLVGVLVTVAAALAPARRATRVAPLSALRPDPLEQARRVGRVRAGIGLAAVVLGIAALAALVVTAPTTRDGGDQLQRVFAGMVAGFLAVVGVLLAGQVLAPGTARLLGRPLAASGPVGRLTVGNAVRNPARVSATSMALFVGVCLITMMSVGAATSTASLNARVDQEFPVDVALLPSGDGETGLPAAQVAAATAVASVTASVTLRGALLDLDGIRIPVYTADPVALQRVSRSVLPLRPGTVLLPRSGPVVPGPGQTSLTLAAGARTREVRVETARVPVALLSTADFDALVPRAAVVQRAGLLLRTADGSDAAAVQSALDSALDSALGAALGAAPGAGKGPGGPGVSLAGSLPQRAQVEQVMGILLWIATGLLGVSLLISLVGIGNTMALSVLERRREIGVLRALGLTRRQLRRSLTVEAVLLALTGSVLGIVLGTGFGYAGARLLLSGAAPVAGPVVPWPRLGLVVLAAVVAAVLAAVLPGRRAGRVAPTQALAAT